ncbi:Fe-S cluster assembly protein HesB [Microlunatus elymi]|uniref:Fe-S cluster assembly protein HesB n=1 Tax=Microlunatus elymi TaxID=2596828 RepID=A0A516Q078_9ACTN|nr:HhH-GPD-type base excision DNA repair protein [Microlunatus elymi]QDP96845.1 Fe-S cluster assembly protein HesB [Microlunatus elymi]
MTRMTAAELHLVGDLAIDHLLSTNPNALLCGMVLDQQVPMEKAFSGPSVIAERMGGSFDVAAIAAMAVDDFVAICAQRPAVHRFPGSMGKRVHEVCRVLVDEYDADASRLWQTAPDGAELKRRLAALPGLGDQKASIFVALLGKQRGVTPPGWREAAGKYGEDGAFRSVADIVDEDSLIKVRQTKKAEKAKARS